MNKKPLLVQDTVKFAAALATALLLVWVTGWLMLPSNPLDSLPGRDNGVFLYGGQQVLAGRVPYLDFWDHKGAMIHFINALGLLLGSGSRWGVWILEFVFVLLAGLGIYLTAKKTWGWLPALIGLAGWVFGMYAAGSYHHFKDSNYTETYSLLFNIFAVYAWTKALESREKRWMFALVGALTGLSFLLRPNNVGIQAAIFLVTLGMDIRKRAWLELAEKAGWSVAGGLAVMVPLVGYFQWKGALAAMVDAVFRYNLIYTQKGTTPAWAIIKEGLGVFAWLPVALYGVLLGLGRHGSERNWESGQALKLVLLIGFPIELVLATLSRRALLHYYIIWIPYLSWMAAGMVGSLLPALRRNPSVGLQAGVMALALVILGAGNMATNMRYYQMVRQIAFNKDMEIEKNSALVNYVRKASAPGDPVLVWGNEVWVNFLSERQSPTRFSYQYPLFMRGYTNKLLVDSFLKEIEANPPVLIVEPPTDTAEMLPLNRTLRETAKQAQVGVPTGMDAFFDFFEAHYVIEKEFPDTIVYRWKGQ